MQVQIAEQMGEGRLFQDKKSQLEVRCEQGASWFFWIGLLSLMNSVTLMFGLRSVYVLGLGMTLLVDMLSDSLTGLDGGIPGGSLLVRAGAFAINLVVASLFFTIWVLRKDQDSVVLFIIGLALYLLDSLVLIVLLWMQLPEYPALLILDFILPVAARVYVMVGICRGLGALRKLNALMVLGRLYSQ